MKDRRDPDCAGGERELSLAIELRDRLGDGGWLFCEFDRAACRIQQDPAFRERRPSPEDWRECILTDLRAVAVDSYLVSLVENGEAGIKPRLDLDGVGIADLLPT